MTTGLLLLLALGGCGTERGPDADQGLAALPADLTASETVDGLKRVEVNMPGVLFVREGHGIGGYDEFLIPASAISYQRASPKLPTAMEAEFLALLEQSLVDAAEDADIPVVREPDACVMQVAMNLVDVEVDRRARDGLGRMTLLMEFRDASTGTPLLRYATENRVPQPEEGVSRPDQFRTAFDEMVADMEISGALRAAGLQEDTVRPGCRGTLAERGRSSRPSVSAR
jgi:hypothetical protein